MLVELLIVLGDGAHDSRQVLKTDRGEIWSTLDDLKYSELPSWIQLPALEPVASDESCVDESWIMEKINKKEKGQKESLLLMM